MCSSTFHPSHNSSYGPHSALALRPVRILPQNGKQRLCFFFLNQKPLSFSVSLILRRFDFNEEIKYASDETRLCEPPMAIVIGGRMHSFEKCTNCFRYSAWLLAMWPGIYNFLMQMLFSRQFNPSTRRFAREQALLSLYSLWHRQCPLIFCFDNCHHNLTFATHRFPP